MKTVELLHELISDSSIHQEYSVREYIGFCNEIRSFWDKPGVPQATIKFLEKKFVDEIEPLAKICQHLYGKNENLVKVQYTGGNNQHQGELDGKIIVPNGQDGQEEILVEITTSCDKWALKFSVDLIKSKQFPLIPIGWDSSDISGSQHKGHKLKGVPIEEVFQKTSSKLEPDKIDIVDELIIRKKLYGIANGIYEEFQQKKDQYLRALLAHDTGNDGQIGDSSALDLTDLLSPILDEMRSIREHVLSEMHLTEEQFNFYFDDLLICCNPLPNLIPGISIISSSETNDLVAHVQKDAGIDWDNLNDAKSRIHEHVQRMLAQRAIWVSKEAKEVVVQQKARIEKAINDKLSKLKNRQQQCRTQRIWLCIMIDDFIGSWNNDIKKMMLPVFENFANTYQSELKLNHIEKLWFVGYKSYISVHSLEPVL